MRRGRTGEQPPFLDFLGDAEFGNEFFIQGSTDLGRGRVLGFALVSNPIREIKAGDEIKVSVRDPLRVMVVGDGFDNHMRDAPQGEQVSAHLGVRYAGEVFLGHVQRAMIYFGTFDGASQMVGRSLRQD